MKRSRVREAGCSSKKRTKQSQQVHEDEIPCPHGRQAAEQYIKVVQEVCDDSLIKELKKLLSEFMEESMEVKDVIARVKILFKDHPELIMAFNIFLPEGQKITGKDIVKDCGNGIPFEYVEAMSFLNNIKIRFREDENDVYSMFLEFLERYRDDNDFKRLHKDAERFCFKGHPDLLKELKCFIPYSPPDEDTRTKEDRWEIEDNMNQLQVLVEYLKSTLECVDRKLLNNPKTPILIRDDFKGLHLRCIQRIYGERGLDVIHVLYSKDAVHAWPIVQKRLRQKLEEWSTFCEEYFSRVWMYRFH